MTKGWITVEVELLSGGGLDLDPPPGRVMLVGPRHTLKDLAEAIDQAFARWDFSHLHQFEFPDGRVFGLPDDEWGQPIIDYQRVRVCSAIHPNETFTYVFDLGDDWRHYCQLTSVNADAREARDAAGHLPKKPVPIEGWGSIPDQYGRRWENDTGEDDDDEDDEDDDTGEDGDTGEDDEFADERPRPSKSLGKLQAALSEALAAEPRQDAVVARAYEQLLAHSEVGSFHDVPRLLYELSNRYTAMGRYDQAIQAIERILAGRWAGRPDGRCLIGRVLLAAGRKAEAEVLYAAIKAKDASDIYLYDMVGTDYAAVGDHESAVRWLGEGLTLAIRTGDPQGIADDLLRCRGESLAALGRAPDAVQWQAQEFIADAGDDRGWDATRIASPTLNLERRGRPKGWFALRVEVGTGDGAAAIEPRNGPRNQPRSRPRNRPPGRLFLVGPEHTLKDLAEAIDDGFGRWGRPGSREFTFGDGRRFADPDDRLRTVFSTEAESSSADYAATTVAAEVRKGEPFEYTPDIGGGWRFCCQMTHPDVDPKNEVVTLPLRPVPIWGWGRIPDQEGRRRKGARGEDWGLPPE